MKKKEKETRPLSPFFLMEQIWISFIVFKSDKKETKYIWVIYLLQSSEWIKKFNSL